MAEDSWVAVKVGSVRVRWRFCVVGGAVEVESRRAVGAEVVAVVELRTRTKV